MSDTPFSLHYDADGVWSGWRVTFTLTTFPHGKVPAVVATNGHARVYDHQRIAEILPVDLWPDFARSTFSAKGRKENTDERLF